jgi:predicted dehydrogenase
LIKPSDWRGDPKKNPGGMLFQCGVHAFHELMFYFGAIRRVSCLMRYDVHTTQTADVAQCLIEMESGLVGTLNAYHVTPYRHTLNLFGTRANLYVNDRFFDEGTTILMQTDHLDSRKQPMVPVKIAAKDDPAANLRSFCHAVRSGGTPYPSLRDGAQAVLAVFAAEESARSGRPVAVRCPWTFKPENGL